jgi:hypothetical protein
MNRSRSGSEDLNQFIAQGIAVKGRAYGLAASTSMSASSSSSGISNAAAPSPSSPGLLNWVRSALLSGPGLRSNNSFATSGLATPSMKANEEEDNDDDSLERREHATFPSEGRVSLINGEVRHLPASARSSLSLDSPSRKGNSFLEPQFIGSNRRLSSVSSIGTLYDEYNSSSESEEEDVYTPFTPFKKGQSMIRSAEGKGGSAMDNTDYKIEEEKQRKSSIQSSSSSDRSGGPSLDSDSSPNLLRGDGQPHLSLKEGKSSCDQEIGKVWFSLDFLALSRAMSDVMRAVG